MARYDYGFNTQPHDLLHRYGDPTHVTQLASGKYNTSGGNRPWWMLQKDNTSGLFDLTGGRMKWPWDPDVNEAGELIKNKEGLGTSGNNFWDWLKTTPERVTTGTGKTAGEETDKLSQFEKIWGQTPEEHTKMYSDIAKNAGNYKLENKLKLGMIDNISKLGANLGMGGAQYEYQAALQANKNSAYVTVNSKMNPGPARYIQPYKSYFS